MTLFSKLVLTDDGLVEVIYKIRGFFLNPIIKGFLNMINWNFF